MAKVSKKNIDTKKENKSLANDSEKLPPADIEMLPKNWTTG
ncbi:MAG TPA: hypothetical protein PKW18_06495 [Candidatus Sumerlaeota bacterium]|nr:hypothetical protein [Candidatus Sumerlaeota bacterium]HOR64783.1 hypothetical protein [Candidatus Sumerlaeota bacterium]HPL74206.1 hypothetical protein [Candidatus Sumerlaeota bacterium]